MTPNQPFDLTTSLPRQEAKLHDIQLLEGELQNNSFIQRSHFKVSLKLPLRNVLLWLSEWTNLTPVILWHQSLWSGGVMCTCIQAWMNRYTQCTWSLCNVYGMNTQHTVDGSSHRTSWIIYMLINRHISSLFLYLPICENNVTLIHILIIK